MLIRDSATHFHLLRSAYLAREEQAKATHVQAAHKHAATTQASTTRTKAATTTAATMNAFRDAGDVLAHIIDDIQTGEFAVQYGQMPSDVNTDKITIKVKCTSCDAVEPTTIIAESLDSDYTLNEDGETYTSLYGSCAECLAGESSEDRLERQAQAHLEAAALHRDDPIF